MTRAPVLSLNVFVLCVTSELERLLFTIICKQDLVPCKHTAAGGKGLHLPGPIAPSDTGKQQVNYKGADSAARSVGKPQASAECRWEGPYCHSSHSHSGGSIKVANNYFIRQEKHQKSFYLVFRVKT